MFSTGPVQQRQPHRLLPGTPSTPAPAPAPAKRIPREFKHGLCVDHFGGRTRRGWHHHVTLVTAAQAFLTLKRLDPSPLAGLPVYQVLGVFPGPAEVLDRHQHRLRPTPCHEQNPTEDLTKRYQRLSRVRAYGVGGPADDRESGAPIITCRHQA